MTGLINDAYDAKIETAPLRYFHTRPQTRSVQPGDARPMGQRPFVDQPDPFRNMERVEFWVKFGIGAAIGALFGLGSLLRLYHTRIPGPGVRWQF